MPVRVLHKSGFSKKTKLAALPFNFGDQYKTYHAVQTRGSRDLPSHISKLAHWNNNPEDQGYWVNNPETDKYEHVEFLAYEYKDENGTHSGHSWFKLKQDTANPTNLTWYTVTANMGTLRKSAMWVAGVIGFQADEDYGIASGEKELRPRVPANTEGNSTDGGQDFLVVEGRRGTQ